MLLPSLLSGFLFLHYHCCHTVFSSFIIFMMRAPSQNLYQATAILVSARISWECSLCWVLKRFLIRNVCFPDLEPFWGRWSFSHQNSHNKILKIPNPCFPFQKSFCLKSIFDCVMRENRRADLGINYLKWTLCEWETSSFCVLAQNKWSFQVTVKCSHGSEIFYFR